MGNKVNSSNERVFENDTNHATHISESASDKLYNSIIRIEKDNEIGTGFFIKIRIKEKIKHFLFTCFHVIKENDINSKKKINIFYGKKNNEEKISFKLDNTERFFACYEEKDVTLFEILERDNIPEDKFLLADLSYKYGYEIYKNGKFFLAGYPRDLTYEKERHISSGKIIKIEGFEFEHSLDTRKGSSGSPICSVDNIQVIGIHKQGKRNESVNYGTFIGTIIDELEKDYDDDIIQKKDFGDLFISLEEYQSKENFDFHKEILKISKELNENRFQEAYNLVKLYLNKGNFEYIRKKKEFLKCLENYKNINLENNYKIIIKDYTRDFEIPKFFDEILIKKDKKLIYFIGGFLKALSVPRDIFLNKNCNLYICQFMELYEVNNFKKNINKIICNKCILYTTKIENGAKWIFKRNKEKIKFNVTFIINYENREDCMHYCFDIRNYSMFRNEEEVLFNVFSFFKIIDVKIDEFIKEADIKLKLIGKQNNF